MKKMKSSKIITTSMLALAGVSLVTVAFSSWLVNETKSADTDNITVEVGEVINQSLAIEGATVTDGTYRFDAKKDDTAGPIVFSGEGEGEDLSFGVKFSVTNALNAEGTAWASHFGGVNAKWTVASDEKGTALTNAITKNYIEAPLTAEDALLPKGTDLVNQENTDFITMTYAKNETTPTTVDVTATFNFKWGTASGGENPGSVDLNSEPSEFTLEDMIAILNDLQGANGATFKITLTPVLAKA